jgi:hypothetical protein
VTDSPSAIDHLRGVFVVLHLVAIGVMAFPAPHGVRTPASWEEPTVQAEITAWSERLGVEREWLGSTVRRAAVAVVDAREVVLTPADPYYRLAGTWQSWRMFVAPHRFPARLHIDVRTDAGWSPLYVVGSTEHRWRARQLHHTRMRSLVFLAAWQRYHKQRARLADWVAAQVRVERPDALEVRLRYRKARTPAPGEAASEGSWVGVEQRALR